MLLNSVLLLLALFSPVSSFVSVAQRQQYQHHSSTASSSKTATVTATASSASSNTSRSSSSSSLNMSSKPEIEVIQNPDKEFLEKKGVFSWGTWGCDAGSFPWTYGENESCYLLKGQVTVTPTDGRKPATFGKGDFVTFPAGMSCQWDVSEAVHKHFLFF